MAITASNIFLYELRELLGQVFIYSMVFTGYFPFILIIFPKKKKMWLLYSLDIDVFVRKMMWFWYANGGVKIVSISTRSRGRRRRCLDGGARRTCRRTSRRGSLSTPAAAEGRRRWASTSTTRSSPPPNNTHLHLVII